MLSAPDAGALEKLVLSGHAFSQLAALEGTCQCLRELLAKPGLLKAALASALPFWDLHAVPASSFCDAYRDHKADLLLLHRLQRPVANYAADLRWEPLTYDEELSDSEVTEVAHLQLRQLSVEPAPRCAGGLSELEELMAFLASFRRGRWQPDLLDCCVFWDPEELAQAARRRAYDEGRQFFDGVLLPPSSSCLYVGVGNPSGTHTAISLKATCHEHPPRRKLKLVFTPLPCDEVFEEQPEGWLTDLLGSSTSSTPGAGAANVAWECGVHFLEPRLPGCSSCGRVVLRSSVAAQEWPDAALGWPWGEASIAFLSDEAPEEQARLTAILRAIKEHQRVRFLLAMTDAVLGRSG
jgi:hypothetical protein